MKHIPLFEQFENSVNEAKKGAPNNIVSLVKKIATGPNVIGKAADEKAARADKSIVLLPEAQQKAAFYALLDKKLSKTNFNKDFTYTDYYGSRRYAIGEYVDMIVDVGSIDNVHYAFGGPYASIDFQDRLINVGGGHRDFKDVKLWGDLETLTDAFVSIVTKNAGIFNELKNAAPSEGDDPMIIKKLLSNTYTWPREIDKIPAYAVADSIALSWLGLEPNQRAKELNNLITTLNGYLKDKDYINAPAKSK